jgi:hypothetical protein
MKALSVRQPWAGLIGAGLKTIETRKWRTNFRGNLLIVSALKADTMMHDLFKKDPLCAKRGVTIAIVKVVDCVLMTEEHEEAAMCRTWPDLTLYAWMLEDIQPVRHIPVMGKLSIFDIPHLTMENFFEERNWIEDFSFENGNYINTCVRCGELFKGHKRRVVCKLCDSPKVS